MNIISKEIKNHFQVIGKINKNETIIPSTDEIKEEDSVLTITGMVSNTTKDLQDEIVTKEALISMQKQLKRLNLHIDHDGSFNEAIETITNSLIK